LTSEVSQRSAALVAERLPQARGLGLALAELIDDPEAFTRTLTQGLEQLSDEAYAAEQERVAPGSGAVIGTRWPLVHTIERALRRPLLESSSSSALWLAQRLASSEFREVRLFSLPCLERSLADDPERSWQLMRRLGRGARDWISVDTLASVYAHGILLEPFRWAELEQLVYSKQNMERRLVGATLARMPYAVQRGAARSQALDSSRALDLVSTLMGDADDQVQKSLSWALREWSRVDGVAVERLLHRETTLAARTGDGHRAWVIRDALTLIDPRVATELRAQLADVRKRGSSVSTSEASRAAAAFSASMDLADSVVAQQGERFARRTA
jgi:3-methyladenine DNA glycosylase AlkD